MRKWLIWLTIGAGGFGASLVAVLALTPQPGHTPLHIACKNHNHGPTRTQGAGKQLMDARALNRQARQRMSE